MATKPIEISVEELRAHKRPRTDANIQKHVGILEKLAAENGGRIPACKRLKELGFFTSYNVMLDFPAAFAHLQRERDGDKNTHATEEAHNKPFLMPSTTARTLADYDIPGACFNPVELLLEPGLTEAEWMTVARSLSDVGQSSRWWIGDLLHYGFKTWGKKTSFDLAEQASGTTRSFLYSSSYVSSKFPPPRRVAALSFYHHAVLAKFPPAIADAILKEALELGLTARQCRAEADKRIGRIEPLKEKYKRHLLKIVVSQETYNKLLERSEGRWPVRYYVAQIIECFLVSGETGMPIPRYENGRRTKAWKEQVTNS